jgi:hypothetical protein
VGAAFVDPDFERRVVARGAAGERFRGSPGGTDCDVVRFSGDSGASSPM